VGYGAFVIALLIPTLDRPERLPAICANVAATTVDVTPYFIIEQRDTATADKAHTTGANVIINKRTPNYAGAINTGLFETTEPWLYVSADDFVYHEGWVDAARPYMNDYGMIGTNDLHNTEVMAGVMATSFFISREYAVTACIDQPGLMLHEGYDHHYVDTEVTGTARHRGVFKYCAESHVEHHHYLWGLAEKDKTYVKGLQNHNADFILFNNRKHLWGA
jgi:glycosyltransferase involved in cell wall biosynthesis